MEVTGLILVSPIKINQARQNTLSNAAMMLDRVVILFRMKDASDKPDRVKGNENYSQIS